MSWSMPALYFMNGSQSPSPPPSPDPIPAAALRRPLPLLFHSALLTSAAPPTATSSSLPPPPPPVSVKALKRKASRPIPLTDDLGLRMAPVPLSLLSPASPPSMASSPPSRWCQPPSFLPSLLLPFLSGRSLACALRQNRSWHSDLIPPASTTGAGLSVDLDLVAGDAEDGDLEGFSAFSAPSSHWLRSLYSSSVCHSVRTLALSTVRLTAESCSLLGSLLFLQHLQLRLFETLADEWYTDFLSSHPTLPDGMDAVFLHGAMAADCPSTSIHGQSGRAAVTACARALKGSIRRLCHLRSLTLVDYVDEVDSDQFPNLSAQSEAVLAAVQGHSHLQRLRLQRPQFTASALFGCSFTAARLRGIPLLCAVELLEAGPIYPAQCEALALCPQLTEVRVSHRPEGVEPSSSLFSPALLPRLSFSWHQLHTLIAEDIPVGDCHCASKTASVKSALSLLPLLPSSPSSALSSSQSTECLFSAAALPLPIPPCVNGYFDSLAAFQGLTTLRLSFASRGRSCGEGVGLRVDADVWRRCWDATSSPLARSIVHLTVPALPCTRMSCLLTLPSLRTLCIQGPAACPDEVLAGLMQPSQGDRKLVELQVAIAQDEVGRWTEWVERLRGKESGWAELERFNGVHCADDSRRLLQWKR